VRVVVALAAGAVLMVQFEPVTFLGVAIPAGALASVDAEGLPLGPLGLALGAALGAWIEWALLKRALAAQVGRVGAGAAPLARMFAAAAVAAAGAYAVSRWLTSGAFVEGVAVAAVFGAIYLAAAAALRLEQAGSLLKRLRRRAP
jgi:putative peptidoglycan lipid II flippase